MNIAGKNTPKKGSVRVIIYKDSLENQWYGVALEFNLVVSGDTFEETQYELSEALIGYVETLRNMKGLKDFSALNQKPDVVYENLWKALEENQKVPSPYQVNYYGIRKIHA